MTILFTPSLNLGLTRQIFKVISSRFSMESNLAAVIQMTTTSDKAGNWEQGRDLIRKAKGRGASVAFLPEAFDFIGESSKQTLELSEPLSGPTVQSYSNLAKELGIALSLGGFHEATELGKVRNTHLFIDSNGVITGSYNKCHLFDVDIPNKVKLTESEFVEAGQGLGQPVDSPVGKVGLAICYDLRFPEHSRALAMKGAEILTFPSAFTVPTGYAHWEPLLRARFDDDDDDDDTEMVIDEAYSRAIENQCYVVAAAQTGKHNPKRSSYGHAMIIDPWGAVIAHCSEGPGLALAEIDLEYLRSTRQSMPVLQHRRTDLYGLVCHDSVQVVTQSSGSFAFGQVSIPADHVVIESPLSYVSVNKKPVLPGHLLVMPKRPGATRLSDLCSEEVADLFVLAQKAQRLTEVHFECPSSTMTIQDGPEAGQTIRHLHIHVLPRKKGDFENNDDIYDKLQSHDKSEDGWRSAEVMGEEAKLLRLTAKRLL